MKTAIADLRGRRLWDSRGRPTIEVEVRTCGGGRGRAIAPAGASTGSREAVDLRDEGAAFGGFGVRRVLYGIENEIAPLLRGRNAADQQAIDLLLKALDGTPEKRRLGANALVATSMAVARAAAATMGVPLWRHLAQGGTVPALPLPQIQIFGGGAHAGGRLDVQDFMVVAVGAPDFPTALDWTAEIYRRAGDLLAAEGRLRGVADEGGWWPAFDGNREALETLLRAIEAAGRIPGEEVAIALDIAASVLHSEGRYRLRRDGRELDGDAFRELLLEWLARFPIVSVEDPLAEHDPAGFAAFTAAAGPRIQVVADDLVVTDAGRIREAAAIGAANAVLVKPNQVGTLSEALAAVRAAREAGWNAIASARSGESEDVTILHLAVGWGLPQLKVGALARGERTAKWNEGLRLAEDLPGGGALPPPGSFPWGRS